jgi:hypothetical protein
MATEGNPDRWWDADLREAFWLEITDRDDLGVDLHAPAASEEGGDYWSYAFVREVREGDVVLHYRARPTGAITHWSRAVGEPYSDDVFWGAHGQASGRGPVNPYWRPGWRHPLEGPYELPEPATKEQLRELEPQIRQVFDTLRAENPGTPLYFPFQLSDSRPLRAFQGYLTKFPRALVAVIPPLVEVGDLAAVTSPTVAEPPLAVAHAQLGGDYRHVNPDVRTARRQPFSVDPDLVDRALSSHAATQEALAAAVLAAGFTPRSPRPGEPVFDLAWEENDVVAVAEIKSVTDTNEEKQLRLALGQVLRYAHLLGAKGRPVRRVIAAERRPSDASWFELCEAAGVTVVWPDVFDTLFPTVAAAK